MLVCIFLFKKMNIFFNNVWIIKSIRNNQSLSPPFVPFLPFPLFPVFPPRKLSPAASLSVCLTLWSLTLRRFTATWPSTSYPAWRGPTTAGCSTTTPYWRLQGASPTSPPPSNRSRMSSSWKNSELSPAVRGVILQSLRVLWLGSVSNNSLSRL